MSETMILVEIRRVKKSNSLYSELDHLTFLSKNLYNSTLYAVRQHYFETGNYLSYSDVNYIFTHSNQVDYRALPAKVSKMTQRLVESSFKSFFSLLKKKSKGSYDKPVKIPKYLDSIKGRQIVNYTKQALKVSRQGYVGLSGTDIWLPTTKKISFVRLVPKNNYINIELGYEVICKERLETELTASIDLGVNNLAVVCLPKTKALIINGKPLKSINQYYNKLVSKEKSYLSQFKLSDGRDRSTSNKLSRLYIKRENKVKDYLHKSSTYIVNYLVSNNVTTLVVGYNKGWKQNTDMSKRGNQNFVQIPFYRFIEMLNYKCKLNGVELVLQEESYTSKCSFFDNETVNIQISYLGTRVKRGLFKTSKGLLINADVNGSLNILRKYLETKEAWNSNLILDYVEASSTPLVTTIKLNRCA